MAVPAAIAAVDHQPWLDPVSEKVQPAVTNTFAAGGPLGRQVKNCLQGPWLGHPLHPVFTDVPLWGPGPSPLSSIVWRLP